MGEKEIQSRWFREAIAPYAAGEAGASTHTKISISLPRDLVEVVRATAAETGESVSATIAAALRRTLQDAEQARLDAALALDAEEDREWAVATAEVHARLLEDVEW